MTTYEKAIKQAMGAHRSFDVIGYGLPRHLYPNAKRYARRRVIDTVFTLSGMTAEEVKAGLVNHDGYDADISVVMR